MNTFLPYPDFAQSAAALDRARLGKQRVETKQIYLAITDPNYGWQSHPAVNMWRGYTYALALYGTAICNEWTKRGYRDSLTEWFWHARQREQIQPPFIWDRRPQWLGDEAFHASHRANLLRKDPTWYARFGWSEDPTLPYVWPK